MIVNFHEWNTSATTHHCHGPVGDAVHVWIATVPESSTGMMPYERLLDPCERLRAERFKDDGARNSFVFARALLRLLLGAALHRDASVVTLAYGNHGKPRLAGHPGEKDLRFNLSHSHSLVAIALAKGREVGVDIEFTERTINYLLIGSRAFPDAWTSGWSSLSSAEQRQAFFTAWTRKEAYLKATGEGLGGTLPAMPPTSASESLSRPPRLPMKDKPSGSWEFHPIPLPSGYAGTVVVEIEKSICPRDPPPRGIR